MEHLETRTRQIQNAVNTALSELGPRAGQHQVDAIIGSMVPDGWEWLDKSAIGGPLQIVITRYDPCQK